MHKESKEEESLNGSYKSLFEKKISSNPLNPMSSIHFFIVSDSIKKLSAKISGKDQNIIDGIRNNENMYPRHWALISI